MEIRYKIPPILVYFFVGGVAALTDLTIFYIFADRLDLNYVLVTVVGFLVATLVNYVLSVKLVFSAGARFSRSTEIFMTYIVSSLALVIHVSVLSLCIEYFGIEKMFSKVMATLSAFLFNYFSRKYYVFRKRPAFSDKQA